LTGHRTPRRLTPAAPLTALDTSFDVPHQARHIADVA